MITIENVEISQVFITELMWIRRELENIKGSYDARFILGEHILKLTERIDHNLSTPSRFKIDNIQMVQNFLNDCHSNVMQKYKLFLLDYLKQIIEKLESLGVDTENIYEKYMFEKEL